MKVVNEKPASADLHEKRDTVEIRGQMRSELELKAKVKVENAKRERVSHFESVERATRTRCPL